MSTKLGFALLAVALLGACAHAPRPRVMSDVDAAALGPQAKESESLAPQAHAHAVDLKRRAEAAYQAGDTASAQILSEQALAAYSHAFVLTRLARAENELGKAKADLAKAKSALADVDEKQKRVSAEADDLELRIKVAQDAMPLVPNTPASPEREKARLDAARALTSQARLLCVAARLLDPKHEGLSDDAAKVSELEKTLSGTPKVVPIDSANQLRSQCLRHLTLARRTQTLKAPAAGVADALLAELSRSGELHPFRDDRGVVVTLRGLYGANGALTPVGQKWLETLGHVAKAHPEFPLLLVLHSVRSSEVEKRKKAVSEALTQAGAAKVEAESAGSAEPVVDPSRPGASARNERTEIIFVAPSD